METKLCIDCKYHAPGADAERDLCNHPDAVRAISFVRGGAEVRYHCESMRWGQCGKEATLFAPKEAAQ